MDPCAQIGPDPLKSLTETVLASYDFVTANSDIIRLIANENVEKGEYLKKPSSIRSINLPITSRMAQIVEAGVSTGVFRADLDAVELHHLTSALINKYINNAYTFGYIFNVDLLSPRYRSRFRITIADVVSRYVMRLPVSPVPDPDLRKDTRAPTKPTRKRPPHPKGNARSDPLEQ